MQATSFSPSNLSIKHRLPLLIGTLLLGIITASTFASYRGVKESALEVGRDRLQDLTKQLANLFQQSNAVYLSKTLTGANDPAIRAFVQSPSATTRSGASVILEQLADAQDPNSLQIELWNTNHSLLMTVPNGNPPEALDLEDEFQACDAEPFRTAGPMRVINNIITAPAVAAVKDDSGKPMGYLVRWRRVSINPPPKQLTDLLGGDAELYFGNIRGDLFTNLERVVSKPHAGLSSTGEVMNYSRDGNALMAMDRPINGTPWFLTIELPEQPLLTTAHRFLRRMLLADLVVFTLGMMGAFGLSRSITLPLHSLTKAAAAITRGDYAHTVDVQHRDELGLLAAGFNAMTNKVRISQSELEKNVRALGESEQRLQTIIENLNEGLIVSDLEGQLLNWNRAALQIHGFASIDDCLLKLPEFANIFELSNLDGSVLDLKQWPLARIIRGERLRNFEVRIRRLDSDWNRVFNYGGSIVREASGRAIALVTTTDITERKGADERFRLVVEAAPSAMIMVDHQGRMTLVNKQAEQLFGYTRDELLDQPVEALVPERYRTAHPGYRGSFFQHPSSRAMGAGRDLFGRRKDGSEIPIEIGLNPLKTPEGSFVLASIIDITERKRNEERIRLIVEASPNAMLMANNHGHITLVNKETENLFGYTRDELLNQPIEMLVPERYRAAHPGLRSSFFDHPSTRSMGAGRDLYGRRKDGTEVPIEIGLNPIKTDEGSFVMASIIDITERKRAREELRRSQQQLAGVIDSAMDAIITIDDEQRIILFNAAAERMFLFPTEDAIGQTLDRFIPERFRVGHQQHVQGFGNTHVTRRSMGALGALYGLRADGEEFPIEASISQIESDGQKLYTVILRDITERKRSEEALKEQARILDLAPVTVRDLKGRILLWNTGAEQMYGWRSEEAVGKLAHELKHTKFPRPLEEIKARLFARGHWQGELVHTKKDGERIVVASNWVLHRDEQGKPKAILEVNNDITERKQAEQEIHRLNEELEQRVADRTAQLQAVNKELEAFSYSVSHDLRAPLRHIDGFSQALLEDYTDKLDNVGKNYLREVRSASQEMAQLIDDVLQLARVTRSELRREIVNLSETAHAVAAELERTDPKRKVKVDIEEGLATRGDKRLLKIVLTNLLGNAWKFTSKRKHPQIAFGEAKTNGENSYFIRDNGAGFDMAYVGKLFGAFQRLHTAGQFEGTGIGLATVQRIVYRHGGRVWAEGAVDEGATFYFTLPNSKERGDAEQSDPTS